VSYRGLESLVLLWRLTTIPAKISAHLILDASIELAVFIVLLQLKFTHICFLEIKPKALCILGKHSTTELYSWSSVITF
jgi:hypothetical protein